SRRRRHTSCLSDWSSDVCSSDLAIALPFLDAMTPALAAPAKAPVRMAFVYVPNGIDMKNWNPDYEGKLGELPRILKPLEAFKQRSEERRVGKECRWRWPEDQ